MRQHDAISRRACIDFARASGRAQYRLCGILSATSEDRPNLTTSNTHEQTTSEHSEFGREKRAALEVSSGVRRERGEESSVRN